MRKWAQSSARRSGLQEAAQDVLGDAQAIGLGGADVVDGGDVALQERAGLADDRFVQALAREEGFRGVIDLVDMRLLTFDEATLGATVETAEVPADLRDEVTPKNILLIGPTGVGKTEIARRLAKLAQAPFLKVEATKFTEVGYVGRDVDQIVRDLVESALGMVRDKRRASVRAKAEAAAEERILDALTGPGSTAARAARRARSTAAPRTARRAGDAAARNPSGPGAPRRCRGCPRGRPGRPSRAPGARRPAGRARAGRAC